MNIGKAREGQTLHARYRNAFRYADKFTPAGEPKSYATARTGLDSSLRGELEDEGHTINLDGSIECNEFLGFAKSRLPNGPEVLLPEISTRAIHFNPARIPNGGFVILTGPDRSNTETIESHRLGGLIRTKSSRTINRYLAVGASSDSVPVTAPSASPAIPAVASAR